MKYRQLKTYLVKDLQRDEKGNAIIKLVKGTTHVVLKKGEIEVKSGTKQPTLRELIVAMSSDIVEIKKDIKAMKNTPTMKAELQENK